MDKGETARLCAHPSSFIHSSPGHLVHEVSQSESSSHISLITSHCKLPYVKPMRVQVRCVLGQLTHSWWIILSRVL